MKRWLHWICGLGLTIAAAFISCSPGAAATITEDSPVKVRLLQKLKSGHNRTGERVRFAVAADVRGIDKTVLIPKGTPVIGTVIRSNSSGLFGQPGRLEFTIEYIRIGDEIRVPLRTTATSSRGQSHAAATVAAAVLVAPVAVLVKGKNATVKEGSEYTVYVDQTTQIPGNGALAGAADAAKGGAAAMSIFRLKDGRTVTGVLESFQAGVYYVGTDLGRLQISHEKVESISAKTASN